MDLIYPLDILGTFAFAVFGANIAIRKKLDIFGVLTCGFLTAIGGGTIRSLLLAQTPFYFFNNVYILVILAGIAFAILSYGYFKKIRRLILLIDAIGLSTFALIGAAAAVNAGLGMFGIICLAILNAVGGGILRDAVIHELPSVFHEGLYATPAALLGLAYGIFDSLQHNNAFIVSMLLIIFSIRVAAIYWKANLFKPSDLPLAHPATDSSEA